MECYNPVYPQVQESKAYRDGMYSNPQVVHNGHNSTVLYPQTQGMKMQQGSVPNVSQRSPDMQQEQTNWVQYYQQAQYNPYTPPIPTPYAQPYQNYYQQSRDNLPGYQYGYSAGISQPKVKKPRRTNIQQMQCKSVFPQQAQPNVQNWATRSNSAVPPNISQPGRSSVGVQFSQRAFTPSKSSDPFQNKNRGSIQKVPGLDFNNMQNNLSKPYPGSNDYPYPNCMSLAQPRWPDSQQVSHVKPIHKDQRNYQFCDRNVFQGDADQQYENGALDVGGFKPKSNEIRKNVDFQRKFQGPGPPEKFRYMKGPKKRDNFGSRQMPRFIPNQHFNNSRKAPPDANVLTHMPVGYGARYYLPMDNMSYAQSRSASYTYNPLRGHANTGFWPYADRHEISGSVPRLSKSGFQGAPMKSTQHKARGAGYKRQYNDRDRRMMQNQKIDSDAKSYTTSPAGSPITMEKHAARKDHQVTVITMEDGSEAYYEDSFLEDPWSSLVPVETPVF